MASVTVDNRALFMGANNDVPTVFEAPAGSERTYPQGTLLVMKAGDGKTFLPLEGNEALKVEGMLTNSLEVPTDAGVTSHNIRRTYNGHVHQQLVEEANPGVITTDIDDIPTGATHSVRLQLEDKGFRVIDVKQV